MVQQEQYYWEAEPVKKPAKSSEGFSLRIDAPGFSKDEINVRIQGGMIEVSAEKSRESKKKGRGFFSSSFESAAFSNMFGLPDGLAAKDLDVKIKDGMVLIARKKK